MIRNVKRTAAIVALCMVTACGGGGGGGTPAPAFDATVAQTVIEGYADLMYANYCDIVDQVTALRDAVNAFVAAPTAPGLTGLQTLWTQIRPNYIQSEVGRFVEGPIDDSTDGPETFVNAWPLDENWIDYVSGDATAGIINDPTTYPTIDAATLRAANMSGTEENISTGWHAIEFLLWGQDGVVGPPAGQRPFTDYVTGGGGTAANQDRRGTYLMVCAQMLVDDMTSVKDQWAPAGSYRTEFLGLSQVDALSRLMTGLATLAVGELAGERLDVPLGTKLPEDEHSCFSDTTDQDHLNDIIGIRNIWTGTYDAADNQYDINTPLAGLGVLAATADAAAAAEITTIINDVVTLLSSPAVSPFEVAIQGLDTDPGRAALLEASAKLLVDFNNAFTGLAATMGVPVTTALP